MTEEGFDALVAGFYRAGGGAISWMEALVPFQRVMSALARHLTEALVLHRHTLVKRHQGGRLGMELLARLRAPVALIDEQRHLHHRQRPPWRHNEFKTAALECRSDPQEARIGRTLCMGRSTGETGLEPV